MSILTTMATLGTGVIATGAAVFGVQATADDVPTPEPTTQVACGAIWAQLPDRLQSDLGELREMTPAERTAAGREIRRKAVAGTYGEEVQAFAAHLHERRTQVWQRLTPALRQDAGRLLAAAPDERAELRADLGDAALSGEYGPRVQGAAERIQARRVECLPGTG